jgi:type II secretory pathway pseudopilin PulG
MRKIKSMRKIKIKRFTIIELIVVIGIIAVLMALLMPVMTSVRTKAKETKAKAEMHSIITAIKSYEMTYGILPMPAGVDDAGSDGLINANPEYADLLTFLTNVGAPNKTAAVTGNARGIRFLDVPDKYTTNGFLDPWSQDYSIYLDTDYDGQILGPGATVGTTETLYGTVFICTLSGGDGADTVYSWK